MTAMNERKTVLRGDGGLAVRSRGLARAAGAWCILGVAACGGGAKAADSPGTCPDGTVLQGSDCLPAMTRAAKADDDAPKGNTNAMKPPSDVASASADTDTGGSSYDKDAVEAQLKRAAKQVKDNCGSASDEDGNKTGPWGSTTATVVLGRNGHVQDVTLPSPYSGKPVGDCVVNSFKKIQFPPYAGSTDVSVPWDVTINAPKHK